MPSPIAHSVTGYAIATLWRSKSRRSPSWPWPIAPLATLYTVFVANFPDLDFVPQIITGLRFHRGPSHSFFAALFVSLIFSWLAHRTLKSQQQPSHYSAIFALTFTIYSSHLLLDLLTHGGSGLLLAWPFSNARFQLPFALFPSVHHSRGLWDASHLVFISAELLYSVCLLIGLRLFRASSTSSKSS